MKKTGTKVCQSALWRVLLAALSGLSLAACTEAVRPAVEPMRPPRDTELLKLSQDEASKIEISTEKVERRILPIELSVTGQVDANADITTPVHSLVGGRLKDVDVKLGDTVRCGQRMACVESDDVAQIETDLLSKVLDIDSDISQDKVEMKLCRAAYERKRVLCEEKIGAKADLEMAQRDLEKAQAALDASVSKRAAAIRAAGERLRLFGVTDGEVDRLLKSQSINNIVFVKAPRAGTIISKQANPGQQIDPNDVIFTVSDLSNVWLVAQIFEKDVESMKVGLPVVVTLDSYPGREFHGTLDYIGPKIDQDTRTLPVRASVDNAKLLLKPQMFAHMTLRTGQAEIFAVPSEAIQKAGEMNIAYVRRSGTEFEERRVKTGETVGSYIQVVDGLKEGEPVVVKGSLQLQGEAIQRLGK